MWDFVTPSSFTRNKAEVHFFSSVHNYLNKPWALLIIDPTDFSTEKLGRLVLLPYQCREYENLSVSVVREEKLSVSIQRGITSKTEIWVTDQNDETKVVSWSKVLVLDLSRDHQITHCGSFLLDEEKKVVMCCETRYDPEEENKSEEMIYIVGEDSKVTELDLGLDITDRYGETILNYTPNFGSIEPDGGKIKRFEYVTK